MLQTDDEDCRENRYEKLLWACPLRDYFTDCTPLPLHVQYEYVIVQFSLGAATYKPTDRLPVVISRRKKARELVDNIEGCPSYITSGPDMRSKVMVTW